MIKQTRRGFTLVELLVVIAIIGMLVGILLPAVQGARNAGRRTQNSNNLKNLGLAIVQHAEAKGNLPPLRLVRPMGDRVSRAMQNYPDLPRSVSWAFELFPYLEQSNLYDQLDRTQNVIGQLVTQQQLPLFQNPGRGERFNNVDRNGTQIGKQTLIDYAANRGVAPFRFDQDGSQYRLNFQEHSQLVGPFVHNELVSTAHVKDGLSKTIALADKWVPLRDDGAYVDENALAGASDFAIMRGPACEVLRNSPGGPVVEYRPFDNEPMFPAGNTDQSLQKFGGSTGGNMLAVCYLDGHVTWIEYGIANSAFAAQLTMNGSDGLLVQE